MAAAKRSAAPRPARAPPIRRSAAACPTGPMRGLSRQWRCPRNRAMARSMRRSPLAFPQGHAGLAQRATSGVARLCYWCVAPRWQRGGSGGLCVSMPRGGPVRAQLGVGLVNAGSAVLALVLFHRTNGDPLAASPRRCPVAGADAGACSTVSISCWASSRRAARCSAPETAGPSLNPLERADPFQLA